MPEMRSFYQLHDLYRQSNNDEPVLPEKLVDFYNELRIRRFEGGKKLTGIDGLREVVCNAIHQWFHSYDNHWTDSEEEAELAENVVAAVLHYARQTKGGE